jgi:hypothetical protein
MQHLTQEEKDKLELNIPKEELENYFFETAEELIYNSLTEEEKKNLKYFFYDGDGSVMGYKS